MNRLETSAYLAMTDEQLVVVNLQGLANNREIAKAFAGGSNIEQSDDGVLSTATNDHSWDVGLIYQVALTYRESVVIKYVAPLDKEPLVGTTYYSPCSTDVRKYLIYSWIKSEGDIMRFNRGLVHLTIEGAISHTDVMLAYKEDKPVYSQN